MQMCTRLGRSILEIGKTFYGIGKNKNWFALRKG
jgi:hypothetical protein